MKPRKVTVLTGQDCPTLGNCLDCPRFCGIIVVFMDEIRVLCGNEGLRDKGKIIAVASGSVSNNTK